MDNENNFDSKPDVNQQNNQQGSYDQPNQSDQSNQSDQMDQYSQPQQQYGQVNQSYDQSDQSDQANQYSQPQQQYGQVNQQYGQPNQQNVYGQNQFYGSNMGYQSGTLPKNRFGMKLTFSILEIISCNLLTFIMGIISCVYTSKANTSYKEGRWEDFKSQAKTSAICLWVGFASFIISGILCILIWTVGGLGDAFMEGFREGYYGVQEGTPAGEGVAVNVDGTRIALPLDYSDLEEIGFTLDGFDMYQKVDGYDYDFYQVYNEKGESVMWCWFENPYSVQTYLTECRVIGIDVDYNCDNYESFSTAAGLGFSNSLSDFTDAYGFPDYLEGKEDGSVTYYWYLDEGSDENWRVMEVTFEGDYIYDIDIEFR